MDKKLILGVLFVVAALFGGVFLIIKNKNQIVTEIRQTNNQNPIQTNDDFSRWKTYRNDEFGFALKYPDFWPDLTVSIRRELQPADAWPITAYIDFKYPTQSKTWVGGKEKTAEIFSIAVFTPQQYENFSYPDGSKPPIIKQGKYIIAKGSAPQDLPDDLLQIDFSKIIPEIYSTVSVQ